MKLSARLGIILAIALGWRGALFAGPLANPMQDYLDWENEERDLYVPDMQTVWKLEVDINGDGRKEVLLSTPGYGDRQGNLWAVYLPVGGGYMRQKKEIKFREDYHVIADLDGRSCLLSYMPAKGGGTFHSHRIQKGSITEKEIAHIAHIESPKDAGNRLFKKYFENVRADQKGKFTELSMDALKQQGYRIPVHKAKNK